MALATGGIRFNVFTQSSASNVWNINHNLGSKPLVDINAYDNGILQKAFPLSIIHPDDNNIVINWSSPRSGFVSIGNSIAPDPSSAGYQHTVVYTDPGVTPPGPGAWSGAIVVNNPVGTIDTDGSSIAPPGPMIAPDPFVPGTLAFTVLDNFTNNVGTNDNRPPDSSSIPSLIWTVNGIATAGTVSDGVLTLSGSDAAGLMNYSTDFGYENGLFIEFVYNTGGSSDSSLSVVLGQGNTSVILTVIGAQASVFPSALAGTITAAVSAFNGYDVPDNNTTADSFYSSVADYRGQVIRLEVTNSTLKVIAGGNTVIHQPLRFAMPMMFLYLGPQVSISTGFSSEVNTVDYLSIGAL